VSAVEPSFDLGASAAQAGTDLIAGHAPAMAVPTYGVVGSHAPGDAHTQNLL
jgi:hypothetical protein